MNWNHLKTLEELEEIKEKSNSNYVLIFKHSTQCSASRTALSRLEKYWTETEMENVIPYYLDLISYRNISHKIAEDFRVKHESPQVLLIKNGECIYNESHQWINYDEIKKVINSKQDKKIN